MSLRRSARNAANVKPVVPGSSEALYEKSDTSGATRKTKAASKKTTTTPKKAAAPKKRKAPGNSTESLTSADNTSDNVPTTDVSSRVAKEVDITKPVEIFIPNGPSTPLPAKRQRRTATVSPAKPIPFTPTPSGVGLITGSSNVIKSTSDHMLDDLASLDHRPASPHLTNAPVLTPNGSQVVVVNNGESPAKKRKAKDLPPDVGSPHKPASSTVDTMLKDAEAYLISVDPKFKKLVERHHCKIFSPEGLREVIDPFTALASGIIGQQVRLYIAINMQLYEHWNV
jgi:DNA-3-methyladenine glycosylase II